MATGTPNEPAGALPPASGGRLRSVRRLTQRKHRVESGEFLAEGPQAVREAIEYARVRELYVVPSPRVRDLVDAAARAAIPAYSVAEPELNRLTDTINPQGVVAVCSWPPATLADLPADARLVVVCAQIRDPGNAGTVIRCADAFGADAVILSADSVEVTNPKVVRASVGSIFHLPVITGVPLAAAITELKRRGLQVLAAEGGGADQLDRLADAGELARPTAWVMGNEAWGLPPEHAALADRRVAVPIWGAAESLNLATAAAVCLYATGSAQRR
ncbi:TrmH family RNA methyltransferase [Granulicoccus sp. GXG6511]|uniref:TrmH family RNA methyltransferase n=1 Tax=Granulicoccus sp. GXG6511 TaxID=3381351 RepID=UPI003D7D7024